MLFAQGEEVLKRLAVLSGNLHVRIAVDSQEGKPQADLTQLENSGGCFCFAFTLTDYYKFYFSPTFLAFSILKDLFFLFIL